MKVRVRDGYALREGTEADYRRANELLAAMIGDGQVVKWTDEFWKWKHLDNPFGVSYLGCACHTPSETVVSVEHCMVWRFVTPTGEVLTVGRGCDGATDIAHQRKGLYLAIDTALQQEQARRQVPFLFGTPNALTLGMQRKTGWRDAHYARLLLRPQLPILSIRRVVRSPTAGLEPWTGFSARRKKAVWQIVERHERKRRCVGYRTPRTESFLKWRYESVPVGEYVVHEVARGDDLEGFVVGRMGRGALNLPVFAATDVFHREPNTRNLRRLYRSLFRRLAAAYVLAHFADRTLERRAWYTSGGFAVPGRSVVVNVRSLSSAPLDPTRQASWDLTLNELELF